MFISNNDNQSNGCLFRGTFARWNTYNLSKHSSYNGPLLRISGINYVIVSYLLWISVQSFAFIVEIAHAPMLRHAAECDCVTAHHFHRLILLLSTRFFQRGVQLCWTGWTFPAPDIVVTQLNTISLVWWARVDSDG